MNLKNVKVTFIDWDDTLAITRSMDTKSVSFTDFFKHRLAGNDVYGEVLGRYPNKPLHKLLQSHPDWINYVLTWSTYGVPTGSYEKFLSDNYGDVKFKDVIYTGTRESKADFIQSFSEAYYLSKDQMLLIEDHPATRAECERYCLVLNPLEIYAMRDGYYAKVD